MKMKLFGPRGGWVPGASLFSPLKMYVNPDVEPEFPLDGGERASPSPPPTGGCASLGKESLVGGMT